MMHLTLILLVTSFALVSGDNNLPSDVPDVCIQAGAPTCPPAPSNDCTTRKFYKTIKNVRCEWGCKHWCCKPESEVLTECPETSPTNPYCIHTHVVRYTINGKQCPVYCGCVPDCRVLTC